MCSKCAVNSVFSVQLRRQEERLRREEEVYRNQRDREQFHLLSVHMYLLAFSNNSTYAELLKLVFSYLLVQLCRPIIQLRERQPREPRRYTS